MPRIPVFSFSSSLHLLPYLLRLLGRGFERTRKRLDSQGTKKRRLGVRGRALCSSKFGAPLIPSLAFLVQVGWVNTLQLPRFGASWTKCTTFSQSVPALDSSRCIRISKMEILASTIPLFPKSFALILLYIFLSGVVTIKLLQAL